MQTIQLAMNVAQLNIFMKTKLKVKIKFLIEVANTAPKTSSQISKIPAHAHFALVPSKKTIQLAKNVGQLNIFQSKSLKMRLIDPANTAPITKPLMTKIPTHASTALVL